MWLGSRVVGTTARYAACATFRAGDTRLYLDVEARKGQVYPIIVSDLERRQPIWFVGKTRFIKGQKSGLRDEEYLEYLRLEVISCTLPEI